MPHHAVERRTLQRAEARRRAIPLAIRCGPAAARAGRHPAFGPRLSAKAGSCALRPLADRLSRRLGVSHWPSPWGVLDRSAREEPGSLIVAISGNVGGRHECAAFLADG